jgi:hypothetical protein
VLVLCLRDNVLWRYLSLIFGYIRLRSYEMELQHKIVCTVAFARELYVDSFEGGWGSGSMNECVVCSFFCREILDFRSSPHTGHAAITHSTGASSSVIRSIRLTVSEYSYRRLMWTPSSGCVDYTHYRSVGEVAEPVRHTNHVSEIGLREVWRVGQAVEWGT